MFLCARRSVVILELPARLRFSWIFTFFSFEYRRKALWYLYRLASFRNASKSIRNNSMKFGSRGWTLYVHCHHPIYIYIYVCIGYGRDEPGFESRKEQDFSVFQNIRSSSGVQSVDIQWVPGFFPGDKVNGSWSWLYLHLILRQRTGGAIHVLFL